MTSLAVAQSKDDSIIAFAGINSSQEEQKNGKNEHFRSFQLEFPKAEPLEKTSGDSEEGPRGTITELSKSALFKSKTSKGDSSKDNAEAYQRVLRLSPWRGEGSPRIAVLATGLAPSGEIVVVNATDTPQLSQVLGRVRLGDGEEAEDVDIIDIDGKNFKVAYLVGHEVYTFTISSSKSKASPQPTLVHTAPFPDYFASNKRRPKYRALRFLSPTALLILQNKPDRAGSDLLMLSLPEASTGLAAVAQQKRLHRSMQIGFGLDVCAFSASKDGDRQFLVAVSGNDHSIELLTLESTQKAGFGKLRHYKTLRDVHPLSMTKLCFSTFISPDLPVESSSVSPQFVKLASVSMGNTIVVHTIPLFPHPGPSHHPRYVLVRPGMSDTLATILSSLVAILVVILGAFFLQAFTEIRGGVPPTLGATEWLSPRLRGMIAKPYTFEGAPKGPIYASSSVPSGEKEIPTIKTQHGEEAGPDARSWDDLSEEEREEWKRELIQEGLWSPEDGEAVLPELWPSHISPLPGTDDDGYHHEDEL